MVSKNQIDVRFAWRPMRLGHQLLGVVELRRGCSGRPHLVLGSAIR